MTFADVWIISDGVRLVDNHSYTSCTTSDFRCICLSYLMVISGCLSNGLLSSYPSVTNGTMAKLTTLQDALSGLGRVSDTPLPYGYQVHLKMSLCYVLLKILVWGTFLNATHAGTYFSRFYLSSSFCLCRAMASFTPPYVFFIFYCAQLFNWGEKFIKEIEKLCLLS